MAFAFGDGSINIVNTRCRAYVHTYGLATEGVGEVVILADEAEVALFYAVGKPVELFDGDVAVDGHLVVFNVNIAAAGLCDPTLVRVGDGVGTKACDSVVLVNRLGARFKFCPGLGLAQAKRIKHGLVVIQHLAAIKNGDEVHGLVAPLGNFRVKAGCGLFLKVGDADFRIVDKRGHIIKIAIGHVVDRVGGEHRGKIRTGAGANGLEKLGRPLAVRLLLGNDDILRLRSVEVCDDRVKRCLMVIRQCVPQNDFKGFCRRRLFRLLGARSGRASRGGGGFGTAIGGAARGQERTDQKNGQYDGDEFLHVFCVFPFLDCLSFE